MDNFIVISGCSGGGKSTLLTELARRGHATVEEPGRRVVAEELRTRGRALPWLDPVAFALRAIDVAVADHSSAPAEGRVFFDRGLVDAAAALQHLTGKPALARLGVRCRYNRRVFLVPPWPEIYRTDDERRHTLDEAIVEYERLSRAYPLLGYEVSILPRTNVRKRADWLLARLDAD